MTHKRISLKDIAKELGLSISTVSRALNGHPEISEAVVQRVKALAEQWNYSPNPFAMGLLRSNTKILGVIVPDIVTHFYSSIISGIEHVARENGYYILISTSHESVEKEKEVVENLLKTRVEGIIACLSQETITFDHFLKLADYDTPVVFFDRVCLPEKFSTVTANNRQSAYTLTGHLIQNNSQRIAYLGGPAHLSISRERKNGYLGALAKNKLPVDKQLILEDKMSFEAGVEWVNRLLDLPHPPDAFFCMNDMLSFAAIREIKRRGLRIPQDIVIGGFSDEFHSTFIEPSLTAISHPTFEMGCRACELMFDRLRGDKSVRQVTVDCSLEVRDSSLR
jgi:Transcriptional regulators